VKWIGFVSGHRFKRCRKPPQINLPSGAAPERSFDVMSRRLGGSSGDFFLRGMNPRTHLGLYQGTPSRRAVSQWSSFAFRRWPLLPLNADDPNIKTFRYEGHDIITLQKIVERDYKVPEPQTAQEVIGYYARRIAKEVKLPSQFAVLAPKIREFFEHKAFGRLVDLDKHETVRAMATPVASYVCTEEFKRVLRQMSIAEQEPQLVEPARMLSSCQPFPWSRKVLEANHTVFNMVPCDNDFEKAFARFLDNAGDIRTFAKLPQPFGFSIDYTDGGMNLRSYYPDFVAIDQAGAHWLIETKGMESAEVSQKDSAAANWCENASSLTNIPWRYVKVPQKGFEVLQPRHFADLAALSYPQPSTLSL